MDAEAIISVSAAVVALTQLAKWGGLTDKYGPVSVMVLSLIGIGFWAWSTGEFRREAAFAYFAGWIAVATSAAGVYGFSRATGASLARMTAPPSTGAGSEPSVKS